MQRIDDIKSRLRELRLLQVVLGGFEAKRAHRITDDCVNVLLDRRIFTDLVEQPLPHSFFLRALSGKYKSNHRYLLSY